MKKQLIIRIDENLKKEFARTVKFEGKTISEKIREFAVEYTAEKSFASTVDNLWGRISAKIKDKGIKEEDIDKIIREVRSEKK
ncbi:MAG: CopG family transcriptional regulator [Actinobacteria bacterium]|nr:CopG family transcriptional regulator [Actinomycetota bacterium]